MYIAALHCSNAFLNVLIHKASFNFLHYLNLQLVIFFFSCVLYSNTSQGEIAPLIKCAFLFFVSPQKGISHPHLVKLHVFHRRCCLFASCGVHSFGCCWNNSARLLGKCLCCCTAVSYVLDISSQAWACSAVVHGSGPKGGGNALGTTGDKTTYDTGWLRTVLAVFIWQDVTRYLCAYREYVKDKNLMHFAGRHSFVHMLQNWAIFSTLVLLFCFVWLKACFLCISCACSCLTQAAVMWMSKYQSVFPQSRTAASGEESPGACSCLKSVIMSKLLGHRPLLHV